MRAKKGFIIVKLYLSSLINRLLLTCNLSNSNNNNNSSYKLILDLKNNIELFSKNNNKLTNNKEHAYTYNSS